ncbi:hypothetical protein PENTCL1PPCAC_3030, partial [Pristionchus entomophagus]
YGRLLPLHRPHSKHPPSTVIMAKVLAAKMGAGKSQYGLAVDTTASIDSATKTCDLFEKLLKATTELRKDMGLTLADQFDKAAITAGTYGKCMQNVEAGGVYAAVQSRFAAAAVARRAFASAIDTNQIKVMQAFKEDIKGARAAMKAMDAMRKGVSVAIARTKGKEDNEELKAAVEAAKAEAANVEKNTVAALIAFNQKAGQILIEMSDKLVPSETELNAAAKIALAPASIDKGSIDK